MLSMEPVVLDGRQLRCKYAQTARRHRRSERDQPRLIHAQVMHPMQHDERRRIRLACGCVQPRADRAAGERQHDVCRGDATGDQPVQRCGDGLVSNEIEHGNGMQVCAQRRPCECCEGEDCYRCKERTRCAPPRHAGGAAACAKALREAGC